MRTPMVLPRRPHYELDQLDAAWARSETLGTGPSWIPRRWVRPNAASRADAVAGVKQFTALPDRTGEHRNVGEPRRVPKETASDVRRPGPQRAASLRAGCAPSRAPREDETA